MNPSPARTPKLRAFSLIELMVSMALLSILLVLVFQLLGETQNTWKKTRQTVSEYRDARVAFETITRRLSQATLNAYWTMTYQSGADQLPNGFEPQSELHFVSGPVKDLIGEKANGPNAGKRVTNAVFFHAPIGFTKELTNGTLTYGSMNGLLNAWGYFIEFSTDLATRPAFITKERIPARPRYRLMEFRQATEGLQIYDLKLRTKPTWAKADVYKWFNNTKTYGVNFADNYVDAFSANLKPTTRVVAENIIALVMNPTESQGENTLTASNMLAPKYLFDSREWQWGGGTTTPNTPRAKSRHQLPPIMDVTMIAVEESSMNRLCKTLSITNASGDPKLFTSTLFTDPLKFSADLDQVKKELAAKEIDYRVFRSSVRMRESKWGDSNN